VQGTSIGHFGDLCLRCVFILPATGLHHTGIKTDVGMCIIMCFMYFIHGLKIVGIWQLLE
jgi:hypothetical protein